VTTRISLAQLPTLVGTPLVSEWLEVAQDRVDRFADATGDRQWIHVDPVRAARDAPFGGTIAHGYLSLSLVPTLLFSVLAVTDTDAVLNYGIEKLRFPAPVPVGRRVRLVAEILAVEPVGGGVQVGFRATVEVEGGVKPAMVAHILFRYLG